MTPVLERILQYLQLKVLQKEKPLSFCRVPGYLPGLAIGGGGVATLELVLGVMKESRVVCLRFRELVFGVGVGVAFAVVLGLNEGLDSSSPSLCGILAVTKISLRFLGRL